MIDNDDDWGLFANALNPLSYRLIAISLVATFFSGAFMSLGILYVSLFSLLLLFASCASAGYLMALDQIFQFARNRHLSTEPDHSLLLTGHEPTSFVHKYPYRKHPALAGLKLYSSILLSGGVFFIMMLVIGNVGYFTGLFIFNAIF